MNTANLKNKNGKTIMSKKIARVFLSKVKDWNTEKEFVRGHILLEGGTFIQISNGKYFIVQDGEKKGVILKTSPSFRKVKHVIANQFKTYRKGSKASLIDKITTFRASAINGQHNCNLFKYANASFLENKSNFLHLAS